MSILVVGLNHKSAPVEVREKLAFNASNISTALSLFLHRYQSAETVILSTCNRVEMYVSSLDGAVKTEDILSFFADFHKIALNEFSPYMYHYADDRAVNHLFFVTASLDSMVLGESQILSQVKEAYTMASMDEATGKVMNQLFQQALNVAKIIHTRTNIGKRKVSISSVAVEFAEKIFQEFTGKTVLVVGAGEMCELLLKHLYEEGARTIVVANRTFERAQEIANAFQGQAIKYELLGEYLAKADIIISSTSAPHYVIHTDQVKDAIRHRRGNPMFLIDIAVPRDIEPEIANIDNVYLYNIDDLQSVVSQNIDERTREVEKCRSIVEEEVEHFMARLEEMKIEPAITLLRNHFHAIGKEELARLKTKLKNIDTGDWEQVIYTVERTINKLLHHPAKVAKQEAKNGGGYRYVEIIRKLFGIFHHTDHS
ncbi:MAG: glutamyl-tRNA reductase [Planctomycetia bacterium]|uniref:Glutamyl-tRNA reductase n=1 Tax=Candidatus Brocadia sapporoensis TaxID=392547 RepID=A0A1V6LYI5_9BACT|nr:glutamyl-tRNA reductase [Candidatus Brocadia sapporoensis]MCC7238499.1 glutamyl-tRNA reductase [Candidatus Brocadia sp.]QOJ07174.1 MAG: glutamyl-tRNA reductase [Planctomycetia bacterium]TVL96378.1 MAG: glutamyl-tRNA reductase [Candidatus Brocadia sp. BL1]MDG6004957.1 glutamyl-tRNA reductase [Candidatus Brocadia sp.]OQD45189.1 glutamyl-tRNA reductase [Candidatus Brocadia sapporoensis]